MKILPIYAIIGNRAIAGAKEEVIATTTDPEQARGYLRPLESMGQYARIVEYEPKRERQRDPRIEHPWAVLRKRIGFQLGDFKGEEDFQRIKQALQELEDEVAAGVDRSTYYCSEHAPEEAHPLGCHTCSEQARYVHHTVVNAED